MPEMEYTYSWYVNAYGILSHSRNEFGSIPLSELNIYKDAFGILGSFREFVLIIYAIDELVAKYREKKSKAKGK